MALPEENYKYILLEEGGDDFDILFLLYMLFIFKIKKKRVIERIYPQFNHKVYAGITKLHLGRRVEIFS